MKKIISLLFGIFLLISANAYSVNTIRLDKYVLDKDISGNIKFTNFSVERYILKIEKDKDNNLIYYIELNDSDLKDYYHKVILQYKGINVDINIFTKIGKLTIKS